MALMRAPAIVFIADMKLWVHTIYALLTKREVKMAGYWPSSFFAFLWTETKSRSISRHLNRASSVNKGFIIHCMAKRLHQRISLLWEQGENPERAR